MSHTIQKQCEWCDTLFEVLFIRRKKRFCSRQCSAQYRLTVQDFESTAKKISETKKRKFASGELCHPFSGRKLTEEHKEKISRSRIENGTAKGSKNPMFGKHHSLETCEKISRTRSEKILNGEYDGWFQKGNVFSNKLGRLIPYRSSWERLAIEKLDNDENVLSFLFEPFSIPYFDTLERRNRHYIPDFLVFYRDGKIEMLEIKPSYFLEKKMNQDKFAAAKIYCNKNGLEFVVWTEKSFDKTRLLNAEDEYDELVID